VAGQWRIRHKLMLGLGLVVAIMALFLAGTLKGLSSYRATMKTMESKLVELQAANDFRQKVAELKPLLEGSNGQGGEPLGRDGARGTDDGPGDPLPASPREPDSKNREQRFRATIDDAQKLLALYKERLVETVKLKRDPRKGYNEMQLVIGLEQSFGLLAGDIQNAMNDSRTGPIVSQSLILSNGTVQNRVDYLIQAAADLQGEINKTLVDKIHDAMADYRVSLAVVLSTCVLGLMLMGGLLRFFYRWVFYPIRDLEQGAGRIAQGDFEHRIEVHSGDEMEDLANAFNDMTGRLRAMYRDLARQVNERSRQLVRSERLAGVGFLAAGVAHEINNPLASIAFCSEALESRLGDLLAAQGGQGAHVAQSRAAGKVAADRETVAKYLKMIQEEAFRCKEITQRLLEFSRGGERHREPADLCQLVQSVLDMVRHLPSSKGKKLVVTPAQPARIVAPINAQEIKSVVLNLVVNALDSMDESGTLTITLSQRDGMAQMVFADTGCGMTPEILENIFEPFYTRSRTGKGTGLGLSISHRIINQHGGEIEAVSPGLSQGSTFTVRLPLKPAEAVLPPAGSDKGPESLAFPARAIGVTKEEKLGHAAA
jgi:signal transduction histidine kinase